MKIDREILSEVVKDYGYMNLNFNKNRVSGTICITANYIDDYTICLNVEDDCDNLINQIRMYEKDFDPNFEAYELMCEAVENDKSFNALEIALGCDTIKSSLFDLHSALEAELKSR